MVRCLSLRRYVLCAPPSLCLALWSPFCRRRCGIGRLLPFAQNTSWFQSVAICPSSFERLRPGWAVVRFPGMGRRFGGCGLGEGVGKAFGWVAFQMLCGWPSLSLGACGVFPGCWAAVNAVAGSCWQWLEFLELAGNGWKWLEMAGNGLKWL